MNELADWHVSVNGERSGPLTLAELVREVADGDLDDRDFVWRQGMEQWVPLLSVPEIDDALWAEGIRFPDPPADGDAPDYDSTLRAIVPVGRTGPALAAGYLGLFSLFLPIVAPVAILVSILAIHHLRKHPEKTGMGRAVFGIVGGVLGILIGIAILVKMS